jgi:hypothetical protein
VVAGAKWITSDVYRRARDGHVGVRNVQLLQLLPGNTIEFEKSGVGKTSLAIVSVGRDTQMDIILGTRVSEAVTVSAIPHAWT